MKQLKTSYFISFVHIVQFLHQINVLREIIKIVFFVSKTLNLQAYGLRLIVMMMKSLRIR